MALCAGNASAAITTDGSWNDWFTYGDNVTFSTWNEGAVTITPNSGIRSFNDSDLDAIGGQAFDIEEIFYVYEDAAADGNGPSTGGKLYIGMVTGYPPTGKYDWEAGDLFIGLGQGVGTPYAIGVAPGEGRIGLANEGGATIGTTEGNGNNPWRTVFGTGTDYSAAFSPVVKWGGDGQTEAALGGGFASHYFLEVCIDIDGFQEDALTDENSGGIAIHWTMECGNDAIDVNDNTPFTPVPEPTTMVLLGMGVLGMAMRARRPVC